MITFEWAHLYRVLHSALEGWAWRASALQQKRGVAARAAMLFQQRAVASAWRSWRDYLEATAEQRGKLQQVLSASSRYFCL